MTTHKPAKFQFQARVPGHKQDAVEVIQTDTGHAPVLRQVVVLGDPQSSSLHIDRALFEAQTMCLDAILIELKKMNDHLNQLTGLEA